MSNPLAGAPFNAVIAGGGGIGSAVALKLLSDYPVERLFMLHRSGHALPEDDRVVALPVDAEHPGSIIDAAAAVGQRCEKVQLLFNAVGMLHGEGCEPEKRLRDVTPEALQKLAAVNAFFLPQLAAAFSPLLRHEDPALLASVSARVGSITDNGMGGWYSYRASKAAHNMLLRTLAREWRVSHKRCIVVAVHPGTVETALSRPYTPANYSKRVLRPGESAGAMLDVLAGLGPEHSGGFFAWDGEEIPW